MVPVSFTAGANTVTAHLDTAVSDDLTYQAYLLGGDFLPLTEQLAFTAADVVPPSGSENPYLGTWSIQGYWDAEFTTLTPISDQTFIITDSSVEYTISGVRANLWTYTADFSTDLPSFTLLNSDGQLADIWYFVPQTDFLLIYDAALNIYYTCIKLG